jgi:hypothetical protein
MTETGWKELRAGKNVPYWPVEQADIRLYWQQRTTDRWDLLTDEIVFFLTISWGSRQLLPRGAAAAAGAATAAWIWNYVWNVICETICSPQRHIYFLAHIFQEDSFGVFTLLYWILKTTTFMITHPRHGRLLSTKQGWSSIEGRNDNCSRQCQSQVLTHVRHGLFLTCGK